VTPVAPRKGVFTVSHQTIRPFAERKATIGKYRTMPREEIFAASLDFFLSPIRPFLQDDSVTEIMVNGFDEIYIERKGRLEVSDA
jgi:Flp pilus assembly CpaF family ATPase